MQLLQVVIQQVSAFGLEMHEEEINTNLLQLAQVASALSNSEASL